MKRIYAILVSICLLLTCTSALAGESAERSPALPAEGEVMEGFLVKEIRSFPLAGGHMVLFEHQKTGGRMLWIANEDTNRAFELAFPTRPDDNTGKPHVFEHATLFGSEKYPSPNIFFNVAYQTYNTYMNAYTMDAVTGYPMASLSEEQLLGLADFYIDACFHPSIMTSESVFKTQAWHYDLPDADSDLTYEGVVYSEILGAQTLASEAMYQANAVTFPGSSLACSYGGRTESIPELTWEEIKDYHDRYYHPSNCFAVLYGWIDHYDKFLARLNETFSAYDRAEPIAENALYTRITEPAVISVPYGVTKDTDTVNQSVIYYYVLCPGLREDPEQEMRVDHLCTLLNHSASVLQQKMRKAFPAAAVSCGREVAAPDDAVAFVASGMNPEDAETFRQLVNEALAETLADGIPQELAESAAASIRLSSKLSQESGDPIETIIQDIVYDFAVTGNPFDYEEKTMAYFRIEEENAAGLLKDAAALLTDPSLYTLTTVYPVAGEKEKQDEALKARMAEIKASMSPEELEAIIAETNAEPVNDDTSEMLAKIKTVTVESLPEEVRTYEISDQTDENGIRFVSAEAGVDAVCHTAILLDGAVIPQEDIHYFRLFTRLLGKLDTEAHTREDLEVLLARYLYDGVFGIQIVQEGDDAHPYFVTDWIAESEDLEAAYNLVEEIILDSKLDDVQKITDFISSQKTSVRATINQNAYSVMLYRGLGHQDAYYRYYSYLNFVEYYDFIVKLEEQMQQDPQAVIEKLQAIRQALMNRRDAIVLCAGDKGSIALNSEKAVAYLMKLDDSERERAAYDLPVPAAREALVIDGAVQYNSVIASAKALDEAAADVGVQAIAALVADQVLIPALRDQMGVYTPLCNMVPDEYFALIAYRDPGLKDTFDFYANLPSVMENMEANQELLDGYIMNAYSELAKPEGELTGAYSALTATLNGDSQTKALEQMKALKAVTPESVRNSADLFRQIWEKGVHSTAGSLAAIEANQDMFDVILNPFGAKDMSRMTFDDVPEDSEYKDAVAFMVTNGYLMPLTEKTFGVDAEATFSDLYASLFSVMNGVPVSAEEALGVLVQYGLADAGQDLNEGVTEKALCDLMQNAVGVGLTTDTPEAVTTRGDLADLMYQLAAMVAQQE